MDVVFSNIWQIILMLKKKYTVHFLNPNNVVRLLAVNSIVSASLRRGSSLQRLFCHACSLPFTFASLVSAESIATFGQVALLLAQTKRTLLLSKVLFVYPSDSLLSQAAARQVSSAPRSLTTVFGMGTGVSSASSSLSF